MTPLHWISIGGAALGGALIGVAACYGVMAQRVAALRERIERAEQARNGAVERSAQAREQIAQLNKAITELRKSHSMRGPTSEERRALAEQALEDARPDEKTLVLPRREPLQAFADTEVLAEKG